MADSTDLYAFVSHDKPDHVTLIANYIPLQLPFGGPNFYEFGDDVLYEIHVDHTGDGKPNITFQWQFTTENTIPDTFLYNVGPIKSINDPTWNRRQHYTLTRVDRAADGTTRTTRLAAGVPTPPCNIGPLSTPNYPVLANEAFRHFSAGPFTGEVFAGQRAEGFYVDLGAVFDLGDLRPLEEAHNMFGLHNTGLGRPAAGVNSTAGLNINSLVLQVPISDLAAGGTRPRSVTASNAVIGVWTTASRRASITNRPDRGMPTELGGWVQVSRLGNPLVNEVLIPIGKKDFWNHQTPADDKGYVEYFTNPQLAQLLPVLYPGAFPHLERYNSGKPDRLDIAAILLTGLPHGIVPGFQNHLAAKGVYADELRLNLAVPPTAWDKASNLGLVGGDPGGYPNGRRVFDDVTTIELRALAGATLPLVDPSYTPDNVVGKVSMGLTDGPRDIYAKGLERYEKTFPYLGRPIGGFYAGHVPVI